MSRKAVVVIAAVVAVVAVVGTLLIGGAGTATADEVRFQNVADPGPGPFTAPTDVPTATGGSTPGGTSSRATSESSSSAATSATEASEANAGSGAAGESSRDAAPRTFGAAGSGTVCDREQLISELAGDPEKLSAWAEVAGVDADAQTVADYIRELRPSTLTQDTQVTNHSFVDGSASAFQAILAKGTAVLVDQEGDPVVRCRAGSPLAQPVQLESETRCVNCPANFSPPPACEGECFRPEPQAPPVKPKGTPPQPTPEPTTPTTPTVPKKIEDALGAYQACRSTKPIRQKLEGCKTEYEKARQACDVNPLNDGCDASVCVMDAISRFVGACASYLDPQELEDGIKEQCSRNIADQSPQVQAQCFVNARQTRLECSQVPDPTFGPCTGGGKKLKLRELCASNPERSECPVLQLDCANPATGPKANKKNVGCTELKEACTSKPNRPDCKAAAQITATCAKEPNKPECKLIPPKAPAATLAPEPETAEPTEQPGAGETGDPATDGTAPEGGEEPTDGGTGETPAPESDVPAE